uniref:F-box family protein n=1 Tax=Pithovirus LCPAC401 TaxID=2506595 RepID=A0A481ZB94_9VIRU|nr:MAG: F-box family protein [Pithovirus LCPAC401]
MNKRFNTLCKDESFWKRKVSDDYGIKKKYGDTWRQTAINMDKVDMINMNGVWIDGRTYMEILDDALQQNDTDSVSDLQAQYLLPLANESKYDAFDLNHRVENDDTQLQVFANRVLGRNYTENELNDIYYIKNREMNVIYAAILTYRRGGSLYLPGDTDTGQNIGTSLQSYEFLREMIDPVIYVMQFSSFSDDKLAKVTY